MAGHLLGAANAERRGDVQDSKPFESGHVLCVWRVSRGGHRPRIISYGSGRRNVCGRTAARAAVPPASMTIERSVVQQQIRRLAPRVEAGRKFARTALVFGGDPD